MVHPVLHPIASSALPVPSISSVVRRGNVSSGIMLCSAGVYVFSMWSFLMLGDVPSCCILYSACVYAFSMLFRRAVSHPSCLPCTPICVVLVSAQSHDSQYTPHKGLEGVQRGIQEGAVDEGTLLHHTHFYHRDGVHAVDRRWGGPQGSITPYIPFTLSCSQTPRRAGHTSRDTCTMRCTSDTHHLYRDHRCT